MELGRAKSVLGTAMPAIPDHLRHWPYRAPSGTDERQTTLQDTTEQRPPFPTVADRSSFARISRPCIAHSNVMGKWPLGSRAANLEGREVKALRRVAMCLKQPDTPD